MDKLSELRLIAEETTTLQLGELEKGVKFEHAVVCKLLIIRPYNSKTFVNTMGVAWRMSKTMKYEYLGDNMFVFEFNTKKDKEKVLSGGPWNFHNCPLVFQEYDGNLRPTDLIFRSLSLWVRIYDLPLNFRSEKTIRAIGGMCGTVEQIDTEVWGEYGRVKVSIDISKPLRRGIFLKTPNSKSEIGDWYPLKFEKLPHFCYFCGLLGIDTCECHNKSLKEEDKIYGNNLKANETSQELTVGRISKQSYKGTDGVIEKRNFRDGGENERDERVVHESKGVKIGNGVHNQLQEVHTGKDLMEVDNQGLLWSKKREREDNSSLLALTNEDAELEREESSDSTQLQKRKECLVVEVYQNKNATVNLQKRG